LVVPPPGAVISPLVRAMLAEFDIPPYGPKFETVSLAFGRKLVQNSDAIWFISRGVVASELEQQSLCALPTDQDVHGSPVGISLREDGSTTPDQQALIRALEDVVQNGRPT
jgi:LysR family pca operon transcriptional activator